MYRLRGDKLMEIAFGPEMHTVCLLSTQSITPNIIVDCAGTFSLVSVNNKNRGNSGFSRSVPT